MPREAAAAPVARDRCRGSRRTAPAQPRPGGARRSGERTAVTTSRQTAAIHIATAPPSSTTRRCSAIWPATTAERPSSAARLNTFEPITTPAPTRCSLRTSAVTAAVISGASAASAASIPSSPSDRPRRAPTRSSRITSTQLEAEADDDRRAPKTTPSSGSDDARLPRPRLDATAPASAADVLRVGVERTWVTTISPCRGTPTRLPGSPGRSLYSGLARPAEPDVRPSRCRHEIVMPRRADRYAAVMRPRSIVLAMDVVAIVLGIVDVRDPAAA